MNPPVHCTPLLQVRHGCDELVPTRLQQDRAVPPNPALGPQALLLAPLTASQLINIMKQSNYCLPNCQGVTDIGAKTGCIVVSQGFTINFLSNFLIRIDVCSICGDLPINLYQPDGSHRSQHQSKHFLIHRQAEELSYILGYIHKYISWL